MAIDIGLSSYVVRYYAGTRYYVGYAGGSYYCRMYIGSTKQTLLFPKGSFLSEICESDVEAYPGFDIMSDGTLVVDIPTDDEGGANRYKSVDAGNTWSLVS